MSFISQIFGSTPAGGVQNNPQQARDQAAAEQKGSEYLKGLPGGAVVEGKITDIKGSNVQIELPNGGRVNAQLESAMNLSEGATLAFEIRGNSSSQISLTPLYTNLSMGATATNALNMAGMDVNSSTVSMTMSMMKGGMNVDATSLGDMYHLISRFPDAQINELVEMKGLGLPVNDQTIAQYSAFKNYEGQIMAGFEDTAESAVALFDELMNEGDGSEGLKFMERLTDIIVRDAAAGTDTKEPSAEIKGADAAVTDVSVNAEIPANEEDPAKLLSSLKAALAAELEGTGESGTADKADAEAFGVKDESAKSGEPAADKNVLDGRALSAEIKQEALKDSASATDLNGGSSDNAMAKTNEAALKDGLVKILDDHGADTKLLNGIKELPQDPRTVVSLLNEVADKLSKNEIKDPALKAALTELIRSDEMKEAVKAAMKDNWSLKPEQVADKTNVEQLYSRLGGQTNEMLKLLSEIAKPESAMAANLSNMRNDLDFMNQMNQAMQYVQLPLKMNGSDTTGDLYVYSDKRSLANKDGNVSAFLHLDMTNLGTVDVYAAISQGNRVSTKFYLESDEMIDFIAENIHILDERLQSRGYSINSEIKKHSDSDEKSAAVRSLTDTEKAVPIYTSSFDLRA